MIIHVCSMFRDSQTWAGMDINQVDRFFNQLDASEIKPNVKFNLWLMEGDSVDTTPVALIHKRSQFENTDNINNVNLFLNEKNKHFSLVSSTTNKNRICGLSSLANSLINRVCGSEGDYILWIESDFIIARNTIQRLVDLAGRYPNTIVSPLPMDETGYFYDTWAFKTIQDEKLDPTFRGHRGLMEMKSIGSCALFPFSLVEKGCNFGIGAFPELCERARKLDTMILCDTDNVILHPKSMVIDNRAI